MPGKLTIKSFAVDFFVALVLRDKVVKLLFRVPFRTDLIFLVDVVSRKFESDFTYSSTFGNLHTQAYPDRQERPDPWEARLA